MRGSVWATPPPHHCIHSLHDKRPAGAGHRRWFRWAPCPSSATAGICATRDSFPPSEAPCDAIIIFSVQSYLLHAEGSDRRCRGSATWRSFTPPPLYTLSVTFSSFPTHIFPILISRFTSVVSAELPTLRGWSVGAVEQWTIEPRPYVLRIPLLIELLIQSRSPSVRPSVRPSREVVVLGSLEAEPNPTQSNST